jgi:type IV secretory pathway VirB2 component (pilin)
MAQAQEAESILQNGTDYLIGILGPGVFLLGVIIAGFSLAMGNRDGVIKGIYAIVGGVCILGAHAVVETIKSFMN